MRRHTMACVMPCLILCCHQRHLKASIGTVTRVARRICEPHSFHQTAASARAVEQDVGRMASVARPSDRHLSCRRQVGQYAWLAAAEATVTPVQVIAVEPVSAWAQFSVYTLQGELQCPRMAYPDL